MIWGGSLCLDGQPHPHAKGTGSQRSPILGVLLYLCLRPSAKNDQIQHGNKEGRVFRRSHICTNASRDLSAIAEFLLSFSTNIAIYLRN